MILFPILYLTGKVERIDGSVLGKTACRIDGLLHPRIAGKLIKPGISNRPSNMHKQRSVLALHRIRLPRFAIRSVGLLHGEGGIRRDNRSQAHTACNQNANRNSRDADYNG